jgi:hypothetical protein
VRFAPSQTPVVFISVGPTSASFRYTAFAPSALRRPSYFPRVPHAVYLASGHPASFRYTAFAPSALRRPSYFPRVPPRLRLRAHKHQKDQILVSSVFNAVRFSGAGDYRWAAREFSLCSADMELS